MNSFLSTIGRETWRNPIAFILVWVPTLTLFVLSFNPALTADLALHLRAVFWLLHVALLLPLLMIAQSLIDDRLVGYGFPPIVLVALAAIAASVAFAPLSLLLDLLFSPAPDLAVPPTITILMLDEIVALVPPTLCVWLLVNGARLKMLSVPLLQSGSTAKSTSTASETDAQRHAPIKSAGLLTQEEKAFWSKLPREMGTDLISLSAEQHYLHVVTTKGRSLILFPISRATKAVERLDGLRVHRSHWIALKHVKTLLKVNAGLAVCLTSGETIPVSRANRQKIKEAFAQDAMKRTSDQLAGL
ncbi:MAG: LytTR family DNA-binding domain-containing protein [Silicimonas sp.]|uniref:LytTR family DNA-binding domain-containing protein n=1 Tax=Alphaproteobacteria TaxID=28211 RepID=UPI0032ED4563